MKGATVMGTLLKTAKFADLAWLCFSFLSHIFWELSLFLEVRKPNAQKLYRFFVVRLQKLRPFSKLL